MAVPDSVALPFGTFERTLEDPVNSDAALGISACMEDLEVSDPHMCSNHSVREQCGGASTLLLQVSGELCSTDAALRTSGPP